ncbi:hypothetical protein OG429_31585 [Streptomyces sp. NBC_00190]|uniref:hypothetical protein n=1 Tax=unclassified Streptomyces TaxID=2593676 RepID=UPI002E2901A5|nr:hypothetical protein [Streptomyces sp. NBC_00190]WSZ43431.1 hypothetical protein OG239_34155 [Streptomyces sp. NBC_00868]
MSATLLGSIARTTAPQTALRRFLALDSVVTTGNGLAYVAFSAPLGRLLGVGQSLLLELGVFLTVFGAGVGWLASRRRPPVFPVKFVVEANYAWAALSLVSLAVWFTPTTAGLVWIAMQAVTVASFAVLQQLALRSVAERAE